MSLHNIHHPGVSRASRRLVCSSFCWPKMGAFVSALIRNCLTLPEGERCTAPGCAYSGTGAPFFSHIRVNLVGPLPRSFGFSVFQFFEYLFTVVDRTTTRWPEVIPLAATIFQGCRSGSVSESAWIRNNLSCWIWIRIQIADPDPYPEGKNDPQK